MTSAPTVYLSTAADIIKHLEPASNRWGNGAELDWVFRGMGESGFSLLPSAWRHPLPNQYNAIIRRDGRQIETAFSRLTKGRDGNWERHRRMYENWYAETRAVSEFIKFADELGLNPPLEEMGSRVSSMADADWKFESELERHEFGKDFAAAQHFGVPTRLLDWSLDPLVALFFAASDYLTHGHLGSENIVVWALNKSELEDDIDELSPVRIVRTFRESNGFLRAQQGLFTVAAAGDKFYLGNGRWPTLDELIIDRCDGPKVDLIKHEIPKSIAPELLRVLWRRGISSAHLMPTLQNAATAMTLRWELEGSGVPWSL